MERVRLTWRSGAVLALLVIAGVLAGLWLAPSDDYIFVPDQAHPVAPLVTIDGKTEAASRNGAGIYLVDVRVVKANLLQSLFPSLSSDGTLVPSEALNPAGASDQQRQKSDLLSMARSQQIASIVAQRALGYRVAVTPSGAVVSLVLPGSPAARAGLQPGDVVVEADGHKVQTPAELRGALTEVTPGRSIRVVIRRSAHLKTLTVGTKPDEQTGNRAVIGVLVDQAVSARLPVSVRIDTGAIGQSSAGLAFALDIFDALGPDIAKGRRIAATGTLELDGTVQPIGGIKQKTIGAREAGADLFLVPDANANEARQYADGLKIVPVGTFDEALSDLGAAPVK